MSREIDGPPQVRLRPVESTDLDVLFEHQRDPGANHMAAFTSGDPENRARFDAFWERILGDDSVVARTVVADGEIAGTVTKFVADLGPEVTYWIGREHWGQGIATAALAALVNEVPERPLHARVAIDNVASLKVLSKCGFVVTGSDSGFAPARGRDVEEYVLRLEA